MEMKSETRIPAASARTLAGLFRERVRLTPDKVAFRQFSDTDRQWHDYTWAETGREVARWQAAFAGEGLEHGDRVAILLRNCREWVIYEQAALGCGLVVVPLYTDDRPENTAYILNHSACKVLFLQGEEHWNNIRPVLGQLGGLQRIVTLEAVSAQDGEARLCTVAEWVPEHAGAMHCDDGDSGALATIVYTSGTTGRPKGVMLSHWNILFDCESAQDVVQILRDDLLLSFLPLSHTFERTAGYYLPMMVGASIAYARSIPQLGDDLQTVRPTLLISVPRIYERVYNKVQTGLAEKSAIASWLFRTAVDVGWARFRYQQHRAGWRVSFLLWPVLDALVAGKIMAKLGGRMRMAASGGAPLPPQIARVFIGLGLPLIQGYGLTETSPILTANPADDNDPNSVGIPLRGLELKIADNEELLARGPVVMLGYWNDPEATARAIDTDGWFHTGDKARIEDNHVYITGRLKEIIVLANGEKVPPADMEMAIALDPLVEQVLVIGDNRPYLTAILVLESVQWHLLATQIGLDPHAPESINDPVLEQAVCERLKGLLAAFPGYAQIYRASCTLDPWTIENGLITPTLKLKRNRILEHFTDTVERMYEGH